MSIGFIPQTIHPRQSSFKHSCKECQLNCTQSIAADQKGVIRIREWRRLNQRGGNQDIRTSHDLLRLRVLHKRSTNMKDECR